MKKLSYGFLLLLLHILRAVMAQEEKIIVSKLGDNATLSCIYRGRELHLRNLRVYWQIADDQEECSVVHVMISGQDNESEQCIHFKNRTQLFWDRLEKGDFSLLLLNVSQSDERTYKCVVLQKTEYTQLIHQAEVVLSLAASYSQPILSGPIRNSGSTEEEVTFSCRSGNGYPEPNVYWINKTDNSHLPPSELEITPHADGTYSVFSTLKVKATSNMQIECSVENKILRENLSANYTQQKQSNGSSTESHKNLEKKGRGAQAAGIISIVIVIGLLAALSCWLWRRRSSKLVSYTECSFIKFADDTKLGSVADKSEGHVAVQRDLNRMEKLADRNFRKFNRENCKVLRLGKNKEKCKILHHYMLGVTQRESSFAEGQPETTCHAFAGETVILPCTTTSPGELILSKSMLYWQIDSVLVHFFHNGQDSLDSQDKHYHGRTSLFLDQVKHGNFSLRLSNVQLQDAAVYTCIYKQSGDHPNETQKSKIKLIVSGTEEFTALFALESVKED
ncbi:PREDICTED: ICOS ligand-like [Pterocles gutturalis]|uniref:ICOS ligand-like n=1 Tax=Pterocles gutturalis TaxID=240206 RepID=UPI0005285F70|nr:PREDICTED: ICOS ligand-like [Pterocles gutturalis]